MCVLTSASGLLSRCCGACAALPLVWWLGVGVCRHGQGSQPTELSHQQAEGTTDLDSGILPGLNHCHCGQWIARSCTAAAVVRVPWTPCPAFQNPGGPAQLDPCSNTKRAGLSGPKPSILAPWIWQLTLCNRNLRPFICRGRPEQVASCSTRGPWTPRTGQTSVRPRPTASPSRTAPRPYTLPGGKMYPVSSVCTSSGGRSCWRPQHPSKRSASSGGARPPR